MALQEVASQALTPIKPGLADHKKHAEVPANIFFQTKNTSVGAWGSASLGGFGFGYDKTIFPKRLNCTLTFINEDYVFDFRQGFRFRFYGGINIYIPQWAYLWGMGGDGAGGGIEDINPAVLISKSPNTWRVNYSFALNLIKLYQDNTGSGWFCYSWLNMYNLSSKVIDSFTVRLFYSKMYEENHGNWY